MGVKTSIREMQGLGRHQFSQFSPQQKKYLAPDTGTFFRMTRTRSVSLLQTQGAAGLCSGAKEVTGVKYTCWQLLLWVVATTNDPRYAFSLTEKRKMLVWTLVLDPQTPIPFTFPWEIAQSGQDCKTKTDSEVPTRLGRFIPRRAACPKVSNLSADRCQLNAGPRSFL